jgi:hypothetical protein
MSHRLTAVAARAVLVGVAFSSAFAPPLSAQKPATKAWTPARTADGKPDLQGVWEHNALTPLERPKALAGKPLLTDQELVELQRNAAQVLDGGDAQFGDDLFSAALARQQGSKSYDPATGNYNQAWMVDRTWENRTSLVVDPPDGLVPPLLPEVQKREAARGDALVHHAADSWEDRSLSERCISYGVNKLIRPGYNSYVQILQTPEVAVVAMEMIHDARIIPLDGRPHAPSSIRQYLGDSRGRWEGDTLVVDTTNFSPKSEFRGAGGNLHVVERFTRVGPETLKYEVTYDDPTTWTKPWTVVVNMRRSHEHMYEYACHEGNESMRGILAGARMQEKQSADAPTSPR